MCSDEALHQPNPYVQEDPMSKPCQSILIDPYVLFVDEEENRLILTDGVPIQMREYSGCFRDIYEHIRTPKRKPTTFEGCAINGDAFGDTMYVDEEGLLHGDATHWILVEGFPNPVAGRGFILGTDEEGDGATPNTTIAELWPRVRIGLGNIEVRLADLPVGSAVHPEALRVHRDQVVKLWAQETGAW